MNNYVALGKPSVMRIESHSGWIYKLSKNITVIHIFVWLVLFSIPVVFSLNQSDNMSRHLWDWIPMVFSCLIFYLNFLYLIDRFLFKSEYWVYILINAVVIIVFTYLLLQIFGFLINVFHETEEFTRRPPPSIIPIIFRNASSLILTIGAAIAIKSTWQWQQVEEREKKLLQEHLESELVNLKNQLNPHFFFNTLNNIYSLIPVNQEQAQEVVYRLSKMMRYLLYDSNEKFVLLEKENEFLNYYLDLMALRLSDHVTIRRNINLEDSKRKIAPLLFISLLENAFKHGVSASEPSEIEVNIHLVTSPEPKLMGLIRNTNFPKEDKDRSGSGIGLVNLEKRLQLLYPEKHVLEYQKVGSYFEAKIEIEL